MYPLCLIVGSNGRGMALAKKTVFHVDHVALLIGKSILFGVRLWCIVLCLRQKLEGRSTLGAIPNTLTANLCVSLLIQPIVLSFMNSIQGEVFQLDNARSHTIVLAQRDKQRVHMLPLTANSPDLSPVEHV
ncbi:uncharacterized protein TNCV_2294151 [Trichonephila clavipes]|nr:uncharacterized protein TNCV_2294151 [Trichonephila clavipes]